MILSREEDESEYREFLEIVAVVLCSDIEIGPNTFHRAAKGHGVRLISNANDNSTDDGNDVRR